MNAIVKIRPPTDADRLAWLDGLPVGHFLFCELDIETNCLIDVVRTKDGWEVRHYYNRGLDKEVHTVATAREAMDMLINPLQFDAVRELPAFGGEFQ